MDEPVMNCSGGFRVFSLRYEGWKPVAIGHFRVGKRESGREVARHATP